MLRRLQQTIFLMVLLAATGGGLLLYREHNTVEQKLTRDMQAQKQAMQKQIDEQTRRADEQARRAEELKHIVQRLETDTRVADLMVKSREESAGILRTTLIFLEYAKDGTPIKPARQFVIEGKRAHLDAMVIKFDGKFVEQNDELRGHSIALFTGLYDQTQSPSNAYPIDSPGQIPAIYRESDTKVSDFERELWQNFWKLAQDPAYRKSMGVRAAHGQGVWTDFEPGWIYRVTTEANGGLTIANEKVTGIVEEALRSATNPSATTQSENGP